MDIYEPLKRLSYHDQWKNLSYTCGSLSGKEFNSLMIGVQYQLIIDPPPF